MVIIVILQKFLTIQYLVFVMHTIYKMQMCAPPTFQSSTGPQIRWQRQAWALNPQLRVCTPSSLSVAVERTHFLMCPVQMRSSYVTPNGKAWAGRPDHLPVTGPRSAGDNYSTHCNQRIILGTWGDRGQLALACSSFKSISYSKGTHSACIKNIRALNTKKCCNTQYTFHVKM